MTVRGVDSLKSWILSQDYSRDAICGRYRSPVVAGVVHVGVSWPTGGGCGYFDQYSTAVAPGDADAVEALLKRALSDTPEGAKIRFENRHLRLAFAAGAR